MAKSPEYVSKEECLQRLGCSPRSLQNYAKAPWFPKNAKKGRLWAPEVIRKARDAQPVLETRGDFRGETRDPQSVKYDWEDLKWRFQSDRARLTAAKAVMESAEAGKMLALLMPRITVESTLSELLTAIASFCEELTERTHQIEGLTVEQQAFVSSWLQTVCAAWQIATSRRIERVLKDLGPVPELLDLARMSAVPSSSSEDQDS